jgi:acyl-CoA hydrolase
MDIDVVATEHGVADLRGLGHEAGDRALIVIAAPPHRSMLEDRWCVYAGRF